MSPKPIPGWSDSKPPTTLHQRMVFLAACQRNFESVAVLGPVTDALVLDASAATPLATDSHARPLGHGYVSYSHECGTSAQAARCAICSVPTECAIVCNPFSDWAIPVCHACRDGSHKPTLVPSEP